MYLKRLTISGFKSFAGKTELDFESGITAIVGPNGSGKSNIADAVRWALGEQSVKQLRMKKSEELVFAGTDKRAKASMAEVSLLLDNHDGTLAMDFSEIELSRVLYRSGESEYRLNGRKVRLNEIQHLLASAGFGQNSYAVIGQGMIDTFIMSTPAERKLLFEEASGIRQYEIKREQALKKLEATEDNLLRVQDILKELEPRLKHLAKAVEASKERDQLRAQLATDRAVYAATAESIYTTRHTEIVAEIQSLDQAISECKQQIKELELQRKQMEHAKPSADQPAQALHELEIERDELSNDLSVKKAELQFLLEKLQEQEALTLEVDKSNERLRKLQDAQAKLGGALKTSEQAESQASKRLAEIAEDIRKNQAKLADLRDQMRETSNGEFVSHALSILRHIAQNPQLDAEQIRDLVARAGRLLLNASFGEGDLVRAVKHAQQALAEVMKQREDAHQEYTNAVIKVRALEMDLTNNMDLQAAEAERATSLRSQVDGRHKTQEQIEIRKDHIATVEQRLESIAAEITQRRLEITQNQGGRLSADEIFALATELESAKHQQQQSETTKAELKAELLGLTQKSKALAAQITSWFSGNVPQQQVSDQPLDKLERALAVLEGRIAESGEGEGTIAEEHKEVAERYEFLSEQAGDLTTAKADLTTIIGQLDKLIKAKFETGFASIARHFSQNFERLFDGGSASLSLKNDETGAYGIEIKATPPGKRVESLSTLSGGERSLTGIALLSAILEANPSPFVVLDEIDAALDEANSSRLGSILRDIARHSQVLVITHNRAVMQAAHSIFGVTMDDHHVSRLLSVKLEEAKELAAAE